MFTKILFIITLMMFGSLGPLVKQVGLPGATISYYRGVIALPFILVCMLLFRKKIDFKAYRRNWKPLLLSGIFIGLNWIFLFESYDYTTVSIAITMNYLAPVFVTILAPFIIKEKSSLIKIICVAIALLGVLFIGNVFSGGINGEKESMGFILSFLAAVSYAALIFCNKFLKDIKGLDSCVAQLFVSNIVILIYVLAKQDITAVTRLSGYQLGMLFVVGIVFTAIPYIAYFSLLIKLKCQEISIFSYVEPITAIILSAMVLHEPMNTYQIVGTILILFATVCSEIFGNVKISGLLKRDKNINTIDIPPTLITNKDNNKAGIDSNMDDTANSSSSSNTSIIDTSSTSDTTTLK